MASGASVRAGKYARVERERRFLLPAPPPGSEAAAPRRICDRYLTGTRLRLRRVDHLGTGQTELKLTQKIPAGAAGPVRGMITNMYLAEAEYEVLAVLPAAVLTKTRVSVPPLGIDIFDAPLGGLVIAEAEFADDDEAARFCPPADSIAEVTDDPRFTGGRLAVTQQHEIIAWLAEYGVAVS